MAEEFLLISQQLNCFIVLIQHFSVLTSGLFCLVSSNSYTYQFYDAYYRRVYILNNLQNHDILRRDEEKQKIILKSVLVKSLNYLITREPISTDMSK